MRGRGSTRGRLLGLVSIACLLAVAVAAAGEADLGLEFQEDGGVVVEDPNGLVTDMDHEPPQRYRFQLDLEEGHHIVNATILEGFPELDRGRQLVPTVDDRHVLEVPDASTPRDSSVFNLTRSEDGWRYELGIPGPRDRELVFERDIEAPGIEVVDVGNVSDIGFDVTTDTTENARAVLTVRNGTGEAIQTYPTNRPGPWQRFPVQGLDANTTYTFVVEAWDWSVNTVETDPVEVTTQPSNEPEGPLVQPVQPAPNETVAAGSVVVEAAYSEDPWPIVEDEVVFFFDKERVDRSEIEVGDGRITYQPEGPLDAREYHVSVEVPDTAGGTGVARWSFHVEEDASRSSPSPVGVLTLLAASLVGARLRRA